MDKSACEWTSIRRLRFDFKVLITFEGNQQKAVWGVAVVVKKLTITKRIIGKQKLQLRHTEGAFTREL